MAVIQKTISKFAKDITGNQYGKLTAIRDMGGTKGGTRLWELKCSCGTFIIMPLNRVNTGLYKQCSECAKKQRHKTLLSKRKDYTGITYNKLTGISRVPNSNDWVWKCSCGNETTVNPTFVKNGNTKSCGCLKVALLKSYSEKSREDLTGQTFTYLTAKSYSGTKYFLNYYAGYWNCLCICGKEVEVKTSYLKSGEVTSCGCKTGERLSLCKGGTGIPYEYIESVNEFIRKQSENFNWKKDCLHRDSYTCSISGTHGGNLNIHHLVSMSDILKNNAITKENYINYSDKLFDINNGVTMSEEIHQDFHTEYGMITEPRHYYEYHARKSNDYNNYIKDLLVSLKITNYILEHDGASIVVPEKNIAIVFIMLKSNHQDCIVNPKSKTYFKKLRDSLIAKSYRPIFIYENEWVNKKQMLINYISSALGNNSITVFARKCIVKEISKEISKEFLKKHHIQGAANISKYFYGLYFGELLLAVMTFGFHHRNVKDKNIIKVLDRFAIVSNYNIPGCASKLVSFAKSKFNPGDKIISWSDNRYSLGTVYSKMGFVLESMLAPDYSYVLVDSPNILLESKQSNKKCAFGLQGNNTITELEKTRELGKARIWDCGKTRWSMIVT